MPRVQTIGLGPACGVVTRCARLGADARLIGGACCDRNEGNTGNKGIDNESGRGCARATGARARSQCRGPGVGIAFRPVHGAHVRGHRVRDGRRARGHPGRCSPRHSAAISPGVSSMRSCTSFARSRIAAGRSRSFAPCGLPRTQRQAAGSSSNRCRGTWRASFRRRRSRRSAGGSSRCPVCRRDRP